MPLAPETLDTVADRARALFAAGAGRTAVARALREAHPGMTVTACSEDDVVEPAYREEDRFYLYLVDGAGHCWTLTRDPGRAVGVVLAERDA